LLRSPNHCCTKIFVQPGLEPDVRLLKQLFLTPHLLVKATKRRTSIARNQTGSLDSGASIGSGLFEENPHKCLRARKKNRTVVALITVF
jgi:hypothetical protein